MTRSLRGGNGEALALAIGIIVNEGAYIVIGTSKQLVVARVRMPVEKIAVSHAPKSLCIYLKVLSHEMARSIFALGKSPWSFVVHPLFRSLTNEKEGKKNEKLQTSCHVRTGWNNEQRFTPDFTPYRNMGLGRARYRERLQYNFEGRSRTRLCR